jgi:transposase-like protein
MVVQVYEEGYAMARGRRPGGANLVETLEGSPGAKRRLRVLIETLTGKRNIPSACAELGIGEAAFYKLRARWLQETLESLEPRAPGRPPKERPPGAERIEELEGQLQQMERELKAAQVREELAVTLPHVVWSGVKGRKKTPQR